MGNTFNPQILVDKLSKLNSSQQSIETLSHWCIFHMNKAKQVVETWDRQFHCAPRDQRLAFLYLANDILQNSRRKGVEFVAEFWKVLPDALRNVMENGDEKAALRLIDIWDDRKVFGSRVQILKEEFGKRQLDNNNKNRKVARPKLQSAGGNSLGKLVSGFVAVCSNQLDEDVILSKCKNAISFVEKVDKDGDDFQLAGIGGELKEQHGVLTNCIEQLTVIESSRANRVSLLRETLQEQAAQSRSEQTGNVYRQLLDSNGTGPGRNEAMQKSTPATDEQTMPVTYTRHAPFAEKPNHVEEDHKSAAAAMAAKLAASSSSAQMLSFVFSSLASDGVISNEYTSEKRAKLLDNEYIPQVTDGPPPPPSSPPPPLPMPPPSYPVPQYMQTAMPVLDGSYTYNPSQQPPVPGPGYVSAGPPATVVAIFAPPSNAYQSYHPEGGFYGQASSLLAPISRQ